MASKKKLITKSQATRIRKMANTNPAEALKELKATVAVRSAVAVASKFSIDAIKSTPKRRRPTSITGTLDQEFRSDQERNTLISTSRDLFLNFSFSKGILRQHVKNVIGIGPRLQANTTDDEFNDRAEAYWNRRKNNLDVRGRSFNANLRIGEACEVVDGDYGIILKGKGKEQFIEADRIKNPPDKKMVKGHSYVAGVEADKTGMPLAYHIWNRGNRTGKMTYAESIPADDFIHCFDSERFDQYRGLCKATSATNDMQDLRETIEAAKGKWKLENMLGVAITSDMPDSEEISSLWGELTNYQIEDEQGNDESRYEVKLGQGVHSFELKPGEKVSTIESKTPNNTFEPMTMLLIRFIALTLNMPIEIALQYFTKGSYSSHRASFLQYHDAVKMRRAEIEETRIDREYRWVISSGILHGYLDGPKDLKIDPTSHEWQWPGLNILDPDKQRKGDKEGYKLAVESISDITGRDGNYWQDVARQRVKEIKWITELAKSEGIDPNSVLPAVAMPGEKPVGVV